MGFEKIIYKKIIKLVEETDYNATMISKGCDVSLPTIYKILKGDYKSVRRQSLKKVLDFLTQVDKEQSKMYQQDLVNKPNSINLFREQQNKDELFNLVQEQSEKIREVNEKIDMLFNIIQAGSQQLTMSLVQNSEIKTKIDISDNNFSKQMNDLEKKIKSLLPLKKKSL